jgi:beta-N-acetylhexosaminidase
MKTLRHAAGELLVVGLSGTELTGLERAWLDIVRPGGIILFRRNIQDVAQTRGLLDAATGVCAQHAFRLVDLEGGAVDRLRDALAPLPSAQAVFRAAHNQKRPAWMREHGELAGRAVRAFGFNTTLAPVLDLGLDISAKVMGARVVSPSPVDVTEFGRQFLLGLKNQRVVGCGKHFPGLGGGMLDSHLDTPSIARGMQEIMNDDLYPYVELRNELPMIMVNHAAYPQTAGGTTPASVSRFWISTVLRKQMGYEGLVFSDDLEMGGILKFMEMEEAALAAVRAGMDMLEICHSPELILRAFEALVREAERSVRFAALMVERARKVRQQRERLVSGTIPGKLTAKQFAGLRARVVRFGEMIASAQAAEVRA